MLIVLDFETFYSKTFSLRKLTTEEYIRDERFEVIGVGVKVGNAAPQWFSGTKDETAKFLSTLPWGSAHLLCHNTLFDGAILKWIFGFAPKFYLDTLGMARAIHGVEVGGSLAALSEHYKLGTKGDEVIYAEGKNRADFTNQELASYGAYCVNDVELTHKLWLELSSAFPEDELKLIDMTLRMFINPILEVDDAMLNDRLEELRAEKLELLGSLKEKLNCENEEEVRKKLASNKKFAELLQEFGVEAPIKISPVTGKNTYALAKNDEGFIALTEHEDPFIQQLCAVRLGTKSTLEESRIERFIDIGKRNRGRLPAPLKYYGAHTGRWAGFDKINFQNLPSRDKRKKTLKNAVVAPDGYVVINCDSSQIEARVLAWLAGQDNIVEQFANNEDVYSIFASIVFKRPISKADPVERFVGKTCLAEGTLVLCQSGWKRIETVTTDDQVWDGEEWVCHSGVVLNGTKETLQICGLWLTPDHQVWSGTWQRADYLLQDADTLSRALGIAAANFPLQAIWLAREESERLSSAAIVVQPLSTRWIATISKISDQLVATCARSVRLVKNGIGNMLKFSQMMHIEHDYSIASQQPLLDAIHRLRIDMNTMASGVSSSTKTGEKTGVNSCATSRLYLAGTILRMRWIELMSMGRMLRATSDSYLVQTTCGIKEKLRTLKPVYDILNSGSRNRFTVLTDRGPVIVHNCILGLGYGTGALKLKHTLKTQPPGAVYEEDECKRIVDLYREKNDKIIELWHEGDKLLKDLYYWGNTKPFWYGKHKCLKVTQTGIQLPNGLYIKYNNLRKDEESASGGYVYDSRKGQVNIWGGALVENVVQALARIVVGQQMLEIQKHYKVVLTVHDAVVCVVPEDEAEEAKACIVEIMSEPPEWAKGLPVACEAKSAQSYGEC